jgi:hypothetical protein
VLDVASGSLTIAAQRGFDKPFLSFFESVRPGEAATCGAAFEAASRIIVEDVGESEIFAGQPVLDVLIKAGVRANKASRLRWSKTQPPGLGIRSGVTAIRRRPRPGTCWWPSNNITVLAGLINP